MTAETNETVKFTDKRRTKAQVGRIAARQAQDEQIRQPKTAAKETTTNGQLKRPRERDRDKSALFHTKQAKFKRTESEK